MPTLLPAEDHPEEAWGSEDPRITYVPEPEQYLIAYSPDLRHWGSHHLIRIGLALFDRDTPERCLRRGDAWLFRPEAPYECGGDGGNVVFPCGFTLGPDHGTINLYYGAGDTCIGLATASVPALLAWLKRHSAPEPPAGARA